MKGKIVLLMILVISILIAAGNVLAGEEGCSVNYSLSIPVSVEGEAGSPVTIPVNVSNNGTCGVVLIVTAEVPNGWSATSVETGKLFKGDSETVDVVVTIPSDAVTSTINLTGTMRDTSYKSSMTLNFQVVPPPPKDSDGDGVPDDEDVFPNDPNETKDSDGDGVGDNADAFPNDPSETKDTDGDGVGDNADAYPNDPTRTAEEKEKPGPSITGEFLKFFEKPTIKSVFAVLFTILFVVILVYVVHMGKIYVKKK